jgi:hypothetical protein
MTARTFMSAICIAATVIVLLSQCVLSLGGRMHDEWLSSERRSLSEGSIAKLYPDRDTGAVTAPNTGD